MGGTLMVGLVFACLLHAGDHEPIDIREFAGIWYHAGEVVNGSLRNELDSVKIEAEITNKEGIVVRLHFIKDGKCKNDVIYLAPTVSSREFETIRLSMIRILEIDFKDYCIIHVAAQNLKSTFLHLFTRKPKPSEDDKLNFEFAIAFMLFDFKDLVYHSRTDMCPGRKHARR